MTGSGCTSACTTPSPTEWPASPRSARSSTPAPTGRPSRYCRGHRPAPVGPVAALRAVFAGQPTPATSLNRSVGADRALALVRSRLDRVKRIAHRNDATVNDVLLAAIAAGLHALLTRRGEPVD